MNDNRDEDVNDKMMDQAEILVVDDDPMNIFVISELLGMDDIKCDKALNGAEAIRMVRERMEEFAADTTGSATLYRLILLDYSMPGMDGPDVAREIHRLYRESEVITEA